MELTWGIAAVWLGLALVASLLSIRFKMSVALVEILVGIAAGNLALLLDHYHALGFHWELKPNEWIAFLAGFGSILLTFMAGAEIEPALLRKYFKATFAIGLAGFGVRNGNYTTLLMSTGLTFGTISALFGLDHHYISPEQYSILVTVVIGSAIVPTMIAQTWFRPNIESPVTLETRPETSCTNTK
jgi:Kef-type K+ transport system membrane component KefB